MNYDYLRAEYLVYRMYESIFPVSFKTRWAEATYVEEDGTTRTEPAFFIERKQRLAKRADMKNFDPLHNKLLKVKRGLQNKRNKLSSFFLH